MFFRARVSNYFIVLFSMFIFSSCSYMTFDGLNDLFNKKEITSFTFRTDQNPGLSRNVSGQISGDTIYVTVPYGTNLSSLQPSIKITGTSVDPASGSNCSFVTNPLFTVTAEDGSKHTYKAIVTAESGANKDITSFKFTNAANPVDLSSDYAGIIGTNTINVVLPTGTNLTNLVPELTITGVSVNPLSGTAGNFSTPQSYTVTALDGTTKTYTVTVTTSSTPGVPLLADNTIRAVTATQSSITFEWIGAQDAVTPAASLEYKFVRSINPSPTTPITLANAEDPAVCLLYMDWTPNVTTYTAHSMNINTSYYFAVIVRDAEGNKTLYPQVESKTLRDFTLDLQALYIFSANFDDTSGKANNLTCTNMANVVYGWNRATPPFQTAALFNPSTDYLWAPDSASLNITGDMSLSVWINFSDVTTEQRILGKTCNPPLPQGTGYLFSIRNGNFLAEIWDNSSTKYSLEVAGTATPISIGNWVHLAMTWKQGGAMKAYIGGQYISETAASANPISTNPNNFIIGVYPYDFTSNPILKGLVDDIRIYSAELDELEIKHLATMNPD